MNIHKVTFILLIIGGLAWGLEGIGVYLDSYLPSMLTTIIYILVGLSALYEIFSHKKLCRDCAPQGAM